MSRACTVLLIILGACPHAFAVPTGVWHCQGFPTAAPAFEVRFEFTPEARVLRLPRGSGDGGAAPVQMLRSQDKDLVQWTDFRSGVDYRGRLSPERIAGALSSSLGGDMEGDFECQPENHAAAVEDDPADFDENRFLPPGRAEKEAILPEPAPERKPKPMARLMVAPAYPTDALDEELEGRVTVCFYVDKQGRILEPLVMESTHEVFEAPVLKALSRSSYVPADDDEWPPRSHTCRTYKFWLD